MSAAHTDNTKTIAKKTLPPDQWHLESLSGKFPYRNQTNILILSWSNFCSKMNIQIQSWSEKLTSILQDIQSWSCPCSPLQDTKDEHGSGLDRTGSGLRPILAGSGLDWTAIFFKIGGSGLDRTEIIFLVLMSLFQPYQKLLW